MTSVQTTIQFPIKKKITFYGGKDNTPKQDFTNATLRSTPSTTRYTPTVKKIMVLSSSESESDSDTENVEKKSGKNVNNVCRTPRRTRKVPDSNGKILILNIIC